MNRPRVLIVDDDVAVAGVHQGFVLVHPGFDVVGMAHDGASALAAVRRIEPDLVLLDIGLPDVSGLEVARTLRTEGHRVDILAITAARELETVREAMSIGVWHYLVKPFTQSGLKADPTVAPMSVRHTGLRAIHDEHGWDACVAAAGMRSWDRLRRDIGLL